MGGSGKRCRVADRRVGAIGRIAPIPTCAGRRCGDVARHARAWRSRLDPRRARRVACWHRCREGARRAAGLRGIADPGRRLTHGIPMTARSHQVGLLLAVGTAPYEAELLTVAGAGSLHVVRRCVDVADLLATAAARQAQAAVVSAQLRGLDATVVARLRLEGVAVLGMTVEPESADEARLRELGVLAVIDASQLAQVEELILDLVADEDEETEAAVWAPTEIGSQADDHRRGLVVAVWGPTGGPGRTTVSLGLSSAAAHLGRRTFLVDADVYGGTIAAMLGLLDESSGLLAAARAANQGELRLETLV